MEDKDDNSWSYLSDSNSVDARPNAAEGIKSVSIKLCCRKNTNNTNNNGNTNANNENAIGDPSAPALYQGECASNCHLTIYKSRMSNRNGYEPCAAAASLPQQQQQQQQQQQEQQDGYYLVNVQPSTSESSGTVVYYGVEDQSEASVATGSTSPRCSGPGPTHALFHNEPAACDAQPSNTQTWITLTSSMKRYYEAQIGILESRVTELVTDNAHLRTELFATNEEFSRQSAESAINMNALADDIIKVKESLLHRHKDVIKQWAFALEKLFSQMNSLQDNSENIKDGISDLMTQIFTVANSTGERIGKLENRMTEELENFKTTVQGYKKITDDYKCIGTTKQSKLKDTIDNYKNLLNGKNHEIKLLTEQMELIMKKISENENKADHKVSIDIEDKLNLLQKFIAKMEKGKIKLARQYEKKIKQLEAELEAKEKSLEVELVIQRTKIMMDINASHQVEIEKITTELEGKYKSYFNEFKAQTEEQNQADQEKILELQNILANLIDKSPHM